MAGNSGSLCRKNPIVRGSNYDLIHPYRGGGFRGGNISLWEISYFKCLRNFPLNFQAAVRNKPGAKFSHWCEI